MKYIGEEYLWMKWVLAKQVCNIGFLANCINILIVTSLKLIVDWWCDHLEEKMLPVLIVCPDATIADQWKAAIEKFTVNLSSYNCAHSSKVCNTHTHTHTQHTHTQHY